MKMKTRAKSCSWLLSFLLCYSLAACNLPLKAPQTPTLGVTEAYQTVEARLTQVIGLTPQTTSLPTPTSGKEASPTPSPATEVASATPVQSASSPTPTATCDRAAGGADIDVTIPDDTQMQPGQHFTKIWRLTNTGTCTWTTQYNLVWFSGEKLDAPIAIPLNGNVEPGQTVDLSVDMVAPQQAGAYQSYWKLRNPSNVLFGIGPSGVSSFWVRIVVVQSATTTVTVTPTGTASPTLTPTAGVKVSGAVTLQPGDVLDLDNAVVNGGGEDLAYKASDVGHTLDPLGTTGMAVFGNSQPAIADCQTITLSADPFSVENLAIGTYLCYRTNMALPGWAHLTGFVPITGTLNLEIYTWSVP
jgi:hypothetical protein